MTINFESSFKVPESNPTLPTKVNEKVKRISPSRRRRNEARAELFRKNKASKDNVDEIPTPAKEAQEEMQVSVVSPESALEKPLLAATVPVDESNSPLCSFGTSLRSTPAGQGKSNPDPAKEDAANMTPVSHVKSKVKKEKVKKVATKENPAASVESSEQAPTFGLDAEMLARIDA